MVINDDMRGGSPSTLRRIHRGLALREMLIAGDVSRTSLADRLGLSQMAATRIVRELIEAGLIEEAGLTIRDTGPGRHRTRLRIRDDGVYAAGITFSAYSTEVAIVGASGSLLAHKMVHLDQYGDGTKALNTLASALNELIDKHAIPRQRIIGAGVVLSANLDPARQRVVNANYLGLEPFEVVEPIAQMTGLSVTAENIVNALTLAETSVGIAKKLENVIVVRSATVIGATILQHGRIIRGQENRAGRIGHLRHHTTKMTCSCGRMDCLNCTASGWSVLVRQGIAKGEVYNPKHVQRYAGAIDQIVDGNKGAAGRAPVLVANLRAAGSALGDVLQSLKQTIDPDAILLAGSMARIPEYIEGINRRLSKLGSDGEATIGKIRIGEIRAVRAAAILALLEKVYSPALDLNALNDNRLAKSNKSATDRKSS
ncbi:MAG TPA: ROK family transcriptional regulator [Hyphomicrobiaceae bacterium]|nr:ROK family transcriptional regulator [Hyphomicrobiaceae bacterium]